MKIGKKIDDEHPFIRHIVYFKVFHSNELDRDTKNCIWDLYLILQDSVVNFNSIRMELAKTH